MNTLIHFSKMHSLGNDFMVLDLINQSFTLNPKLIREWAHRKTGIGFDQLLVVEPPIQPDADFMYRIYNADGSESGLCGNGARCFARYVIEQQLCPKKRIIVDTVSTRLELLCDYYPEIAVVFPPPTIPDPLLREVVVAGTMLRGVFLQLGNPHYICVLPKIDDFPLQKIGKALQQHPIFSQGVNLGVVEILARNHLRLRTYERGVGETAACGSNACAAMIASFLLQHTGPEVKVESPGGANHLRWEGPEHSYTLTGPACTVYSAQTLVAYPNKFHHSPF